MNDTPAAPSKRRLLIFYIVLAVATAVVATTVFSAGENRHAQKSIAGGYDSAADNPCLGAQFDVKQSGKFVSLENADDTLGGVLELDGTRLTGDVSCAKGGEQEIKARVKDERMAGTLDGKPLAATLERDPPAPGSQRPLKPSDINGDYKLAPESLCLGGKISIEKGRKLKAKKREAGELGYSKGEVTGQATCGEGGKVKVLGKAVDRELRLTFEGADGAERVTATKQRTFPELLAAFFLAVAVVMLTARLFGWLAVRIAQPRVMGEVVAGIVLGPTLLGLFLPEVQAAIFPKDIIPAIGVVANLGLIFYMFLVGLEIDPAQLKGRISQAAAISNASVALPMMLGIAVALPIYELVGPDQKFVAFALFMGVAMSITAFPVLARILVERRMLKRPVGALTLACAAIDDVTAWFLIALATAVAVAGNASDVVETILLAIAFVLVMGFLVRPVLGRLSDAYDEAGRVPSGWIAAIFAGVLLSAYTTETIGIALIFGAFIMGTIMPRHAELTEDVTRRIEDFVVTLLLPLFFAFTGLRTNVGLLDRPELWILTGVLIAVAIVGKLAGAMIAARLTGFDWRASGVIGTLMNTRGLTELIVLNLALEAGVISEALFAALVLMALVTTFMAGPLLRLLDPKNTFGAPVEEELDDARAESQAAFPTLEVPEHSILVAPQSDESLERLGALAKALAESTPPRELILARLVRPPRGSGVRGGLQTQNRLLEDASAEVSEARNELIAEGVAARSVAFISADPGADLARLADREEVDLLLTDGARPLLGEGVPRGAVGKMLEEAPSDVAVLVARGESSVQPGPDAPVIVPFGGVEHDWAALELGAWIASATGAPLKLLGAAGDTEEGNGTKVSRMLGDAGLLVQQYSGVRSEPVVAERGRDGIIAAAAGAGLLVVGLSERWRDEGLGPTRSEIARAAPSPVLFVRRGTRTGALAPRDDVTRFSWSSPGMAGGGITS